MKVYDNYEISGCHRLDKRGRPHRSGQYTETCDDGQARYWTLFGHIDGEGVQAIGDFATRQEAEQVYFRITGQPFADACEADARLRIMHAGPKLLEALIACANILADYDESDGEEGKAWRKAVGAIAEATDNPQPEALKIERDAEQNQAAFDTAPFSCHCPGSTPTSSAMEAETRMTVASFIGDEWHCGCGNQPHTDGFYPCLQTGEYVEPTEESWPRGDLYRCARCDAIIQFDDERNTGAIVGQTEARFLDMVAP